MINSVIGYTGYEALKNMCYSFYEYVTKNQGVFSAMFWYTNLKVVKKTMLSQNHMTGCLKS